MTEDKNKELEAFFLRSRLNSVKTSNYINLINILFKDMLFSMSCKSVCELLAFFETNIPYETKINSPSQIENIYDIHGNDYYPQIKNFANLNIKLNEESAFCKETENPEVDLNTTQDYYNSEENNPNEKLAIFHIILSYKDGKFDYSYSVEDLIAEIKKIFDEGLEKLRVPIVSFDEEEK